MYQLNAKIQNAILTLVCQSYAMTQKGQPGLSMGDVSAKVTQNTGSKVTTGTVMRFLGGYAHKYPDFRPFAQKAVGFVYARYAKKNLELGGDPLHVPPFIAAAVHQGDVPQDDGQESDDSSEDSRNCWKYHYSRSDPLRYNSDYRLEKVAVWEEQIQKLKETIPTPDVETQESVLELDRAESQQLLKQDWSSTKVTLRMVKGSLGCPIEWKYRMDGTGIRRVDIGMESRGCFKFDLEKANGGIKTKVLAALKELVLDDNRLDALLPSFDFAWPWCEITVALKSIDVDIPYRRGVIAKTSEGEMIKFRHSNPRNAAKRVPPGNWGAFEHC
jgi:hypothetical protein